MKIFFFLLITLFFATIGFAEVSHQSDETNKKIEKIEEKLDTTKEELTKYTQITEDTKERVLDISSSVDRFGILVTFFGVLITGIVIFFSIRSTREAKLEAKEEAKRLLQEWIDKEAKNVFETKVNGLSDELQAKGDEILKRIEEKANAQHQRHEEDHQNWMLNLNSTQDEKDKVEKEAKQIEGKKEEDLTFNDYWIKIVNQVNSKAYDAALFLIDKAMKLTSISEEQAVGLFVTKGAVLSENGKLDEAIKVCDEIIQAYKKSKNNTFVTYSVMAEFNKGLTLARQGKHIEAIKTYNEIIANNKMSKIEVVLAQVVNAIINKVEIEVILDEPISDENAFIEQQNIAPKYRAVFDMLLILQNAKILPQETELQLWIEKHKDVKNPTWSFDELESWIEKVTYGEDIKARIRNYIEIFKTHLRRA